MTGVRISALPPIVSPATSDVFPVVQSGVTYQETVEQLFTLFGTDAILTNPQITGCILDSNGNEILCFTPVSSAVNYVNITDSATGNAPIIQAKGTDANIALTLKGSGTGGVMVQGVTNGGTAPVGFVGQFISSVVASGSAVSFTSGTTKDLTSISLPAGDWDVWGNIGATSTMALGQMTAWISSTSATVPDGSLVSSLNGCSVATNLAMAVPQLRFNVSTTTSVYISANISSSGTITGFGAIYARLRR